MRAHTPIHTHTDTDTRKVTSGDDELAMSLEEGDHFSGPDGGDESLEDVFIHPIVHSLASLGPALYSVSNAC